MSDSTQTDIELSIESVKKQAVKGVFLLTGRTFLIQGITLVAIFLLTIYLDPRQYGTFTLVTAVISFFTYFSDIGLAAALIQKKEKPSQEELQTTFTVQQLLVLLLVIVILLMTPLFKKWYDLAPDGVYLLWALTFSFILSSLKTIPSVLMERRLDFNRLVIPQIVETILFYTTAVLLAWQGFGISSLTVAVILRGVSGLVIIYLLQPWRIGFAWSKEALSNLLKFGVPYQLNTFLAVAKDDGMILVLGGILGTAGLGLLGWAQKWAAAPLRFFMDQVIKVTFPAYSRMQDHKDELSAALNRSIFFICLLVFPTLVGLGILAYPLTIIIPKYLKWQPALLAFYLIGVNIAFAAVSTPLTNLLNAIGQIKTTFKLMIMWTVLTWLLVPILAIKFSVNGAALGFSLVGISSVIAIYIASKYVRIDFINSIFKPMLATLVMAVLMFLTKGYFSTNLFSIIELIIVATLVYLSILFILAPQQIKQDGLKIFNLIRGKKQ